MYSQFTASCTAQHQADLHRSAAAARRAKIARAQPRTHTPKAEPVYRMPRLHGWAVIRPKTA